jgi:chromosome segregation ATPase
LKLILLHKHRMDTSTMACYESEILSFQHMSMERQIREMHHYPMEKSIQQFFRDSPDLCLSICIALEEKVKLTVTILKKAMDKAEQCLLEKEAAIQRLIQQMAVITREKDMRIADKEEMLQQVRKEQKERIDEKNAHIAEKNELLQQAKKEKEERIEEKNVRLAEKEERIEEKNARLAEKEERIEEKNACIAEKNYFLQQAREEQKARLEEKERLIQEMRHRSEAEKKLLTTMLERANTEALNLSQSLSVRGMLEKIEHQYSDKRRKGGADVSRRTVWVEILHNNDALRHALTKHCSERNMESKVDAVATTITQIYRQVSDEIHHAGYDEIPIQKSKFHGIQLAVLRDLCASTHFAIREI